MGERILCFAASSWIAGRSRLESFDLAWVQRTVAKESDVYRHHAAGLVDLRDIVGEEGQVVAAARQAPVPAQIGQDVELLAIAPAPLGDVGERIDLAGGEVVVIGRGVGVGHGGVVERDDGVPVAGLDALGEDAPARSRYSRCARNSHPPTSL